MCESLRCIDDGKKHVLVLFGGTPKDDFPEIVMRVRTVVPHLYSRFHIHPFRFEEL